MATNANPTPNEIVKSSPKIKACIIDIVNSEAQTALLYDKYKATAKAEAVRLGITDRGTLTALLKLSGDNDARRMSIVAGFVFPANPANRAQLDKATEINANAKDANKRVSQDVMRELQSSKVPLTIAEAKAAVEKKKAEKSERSPGGKTNQTESSKPTGKLTPAKIEAHLNGLIDAVVAYGNEHEYDLDDLTAMLEARFAAADAEGDENEEDGE